MFVVLIMSNKVWRNKKIYIFLMYIVLFSYIILVLLWPNILSSWPLQQLGHPARFSKNLFDWIRWQMFLKNENIKAIVWYLKRTILGNTRCTTAAIDQKRSENYTWSIKVNVFISWQLTCYKLFFLETNLLQPVLTPWYYRSTDIFSLPLFATGSFCYNHENLHK